VPAAAQVAVPKAAPETTVVAAASQGLYTLVHLSAQRKHLPWDMWRVVSVFKRVSVT